MIFQLALLLLFLVLAAQCESLTLPLAIVMIVPMGLLAAMAGVWLTHGDNKVFTRRIPRWALETYRPRQTPYSAPVG